jgi:hypothetical protein
LAHSRLSESSTNWKPVFNILEATCEVLLVNAQHVKALPPAIMKALANAHPVRRGRATVQRLVKRLESLGYQVSLQSPSTDARP